MATSTLARRLAMQDLEDAPMLPHECRTEEPNRGRQGYGIAIKLLFGIGAVVALGAVVIHLTASNPRVKLRNAVEVDNKFDLGMLAPIAHFFHLGGEPETSTTTRTVTVTTAPARTSTTPAVVAPQVDEDMKASARAHPTDCAGPGDDCSAASCCKQEGFQCYQKDSTWAACKSTCTEDGWSCKELGQRTPMNMSAEGAGPGQICASAKKCKQEGYQCFQMNDYYSACKVTCNAKDWTCKLYGERTPLKSDTTCAWGADICAPSACCVAEGLQCYERDEYWSSCMSSCQESMDFGNGPEKWSCKALGERRKVELGCTWMNEECGATKLCCHEGMQCVQKDARRAYCTHFPNQAGWSGTILGGARGEWAVPAVPPGSKNESGVTLFCLMAVLQGSYEDGLMKVARDKKASIFACDASATFFSWQSARGDTAGANLGQFGQAWSSVINTDVFINVWEQVLKDGRYNEYDWTVKIDPDSVFFPHRLSSTLGALRAPKGWPIYIKNTAKDFGFLGACEVLSVTAMQKFFRYYHECFRTISAHSGEDGFMKGCMDMIGAGYMLALDVLNTPHHDGPCSDPNRVTFHPRKDAGSWDACYREATR